MNNDILLKLLKHRPEAYEKGTAPFWDDAHISKGMLKAHLDPDFDAATRKPDFVQKSARWISECTNGGRGRKLLDLGCGPGIYAELFTEAGFEVTGIDMSRRSVDYAKAMTLQKGSNINYICGNYLDIDYVGAFDTVTLIYCDFGVFNPRERSVILKKIVRALKPGGRFIFDVCSQKQYEGRSESSSWSFCDGGFWSEAPHTLLYSFLRYDADNTFGDRYIIVEKDDIRCFNIWNYCFSKEELQADLSSAGFSGIDFYSSIAGAAFTDTSEIICAVARN